MVPGLRAVYLWWPPESTSSSPRPYWGGELYASLVTPVSFLGGAQPPRATITGVGQFLLILFRFPAWRREKCAPVATTGSVYRPVVAGGAHPAEFDLAETPNVYRSVFCLSQSRRTAALITLASDTPPLAVEVFRRVQTWGGLGGRLTGTRFVG